MSTFDRYMLMRYVETVGVFACAAAGLFVVVDGFVNLDQFQHAVEKQNGGTGMLFLLLADHYFFQSLMIADIAGPSLVVISVIAVLASFLKRGEFHPMLAAGVPAYRATRSLLWGVILANLLLIANQELVLPRVAMKLERRHGQTLDDGKRVEPQFDPRWKIFVTGESIISGRNLLLKPQFRLPPTISRNQSTLLADEAHYLPPTDDQPRGGWHLINIANSYESLLLTETGSEVLVLQPNGTDVFVHCHLTPSQLSKRTSNFGLMSTFTLWQRLQEPYSSAMSRRGMLTNFHSRFTRPLLTLVGLFIVIPMIVRRDRMSNMQQVTNIALCTLVLGIVYGLTLGAGVLGQSGLIRAEQAAWLPIVFGGTFASWLSGIVRT